MKGIEYKIQIMTGSNEERDNNKKKNCQFSSAAAAAAVKHHPAGTCFRVALGILAGVLGTPSVLIF